jgi:hypothetical protein
MLCACIVFVAAAALAQSGLQIVGVSNGSIANIDLVNGKAVNSHVITVPGKTVVGSFGSARDPQTGTVYAVVGYSTGGRFLITVDPATGAGTHIGQTPQVTDIAIGADGTLYATGGDFSSSPLYVLNTATGAGTPLAQLNPGFGHTLTFNAETGLLYHGTYTCDDSCYFYVESFDPQSPSDPTKDVFALDLGIESGAMVHLRGSYFLVGDVSNLQVVLLNVATGRASYLPSDSVWQGLTTTPTRGVCPPASSLYATGPFEGPSLLYSVDPATGAAAFVGPVGFNDITGIDFASDGVLYAVGKRDDDSGVQVLLTIDPCTGQGTEVGPTGTTLREMVAAPGGGLYSYSGQNFSIIDRVTGAASTIGNSGITADDFGLEYSPTDDKIYFATIFNSVGTLYTVDPATGASAVVSPLSLPVNITALRAMDFNPGTNTIYALIADSAFPGTTLLATVDTAGHVVSSVATTSRFTTLAFKNGTPNVNYQLTVIKEGSGIGTVTSLPSGIDCGATCEFAFDTGTSVTLTAVPDGGSRFDGWSGACTGTGSTCVTTMNAMRTVRARFTRVHHLGLGYGGANHGHAARVTINDAGSIHSCSLDEGCDILVGQGEILLHAEPGPGGTFTQWEGSCSNGDLSSVDCQLNVNSDTSINADFFGPNRLTILVQTNDQGAYVYDGTGSHFCAGSGHCTFDYPPGTPVTLFAARANHSVFKQFDIDCGGATCNLNMSTDHVVIATFADGFFIQLSNQGTGNGSVDPHVYCDLDECNATFEVGTTVPLTAIPSPGSQFIGWGGACTGTGTCQLTSNLPEDISVTATFDLLPPQTLTVSKTGNGSGTVNSNPAGIACGATCNNTFAATSTVTLTPTSANGSSFTGWSGDCTGMGMCQVTMNAARNVTATFSLQSFTLNVGMAGTGVGTVTGTGINCPGTCSVSNLYGTMLTLTGSPAVESSFAGWSGACTGTGTCQVTFDAAKNVTANFTFVGPFQFGTMPPPATVPAGQPAQFNLSIMENAGSSGTITFACAGLPSGAACTFNPNSIPFTAGTNTTVNTQLTITTTPRTIAALNSPREVSPIWAVSLFAVIFAIPRRRRTYAIFALSVALLVMLPACGAGGQSSTTTPTKTQSGTPAGSYTVTINGATGTVSKTTTVNLVVQ